TALGLIEPESPPVASASVLAELRILPRSDSLSIPRLFIASSIEEPTASTPAPIALATVAAAASTSAPTSPTPSITPSKIVPAGSPLWLGYQHQSVAWSRLSTL